MDMVVRRYINLQMMATLLKAVTNGHDIKHSFAYHFIFCISLQLCKPDSRSCHTIIFTITNCEQ